jgi:hypothetical protein
MASHSLKHSRHAARRRYLSVHSIRDGNWLIVLAARVLAAVIEMVVEHLLHVPPSSL